MCVFECRFLHKSAVTAEAKKGVSDSLKVKLQDGCELPNTGAGSETRVLCKSSALLTSEAFLQLDFTSWMFSILLFEWGLENTSIWYLKGIGAAT